MKKITLGLISGRLEYLLDSLNISQIDFSRKTGIQTKSVSNYINGNSFPNYFGIESILKAYPGLNARWLLLGEGEIWDLEPESDNDLTAMEAHDQRLEYMVRSVHEPKIEQVEASNIIMLQEKIAMLQMLLTAKEQLIDSQKREIELLRK